MHWQTTRYDIDLSVPRIMGIVNITPDSFSAAPPHDPNFLRDTSAQVRLCERLIKEGADMLDIGGESSRPGGEIVTLSEELARVLPLVRAALSLGVPLSVDTYKSEVMAACLEHGVDIINDIYALTQGPSTPGGASALEVVRRHGSCGVCLMHMHGTPKTMGRDPMVGQAPSQVRAFFERRTQELVGVGIAPGRLVLDPGIGFGKTVAQNFALLAHQRQLLELGYPLLVGWSRKSSLGALLQDDKGQPLAAHLRQGASVAAALLAVERGARVVRVHDVAATREALTIWGAVNQEETLG